MTYINPNAISNSGNEKYFTNRRSKIDKLILNFLTNADLLTDFLVSQFEEQKYNRTLSKAYNNIEPDPNDFRTILQIQKKNSRGY